MPIFHELHPKAGRCSYAQVWTPLWMHEPDGYHINRGSLVIMASETHAQPLFTEMVGAPLDFDSQISWLDKSFKQAGAPPELAVPTEELAEAVQRRCPNSKIFVDPQPRELTRVCKEMHPDHLEVIPFSIVQMLGEKKAHELYLDAEDFLHLELWRTIQDDEVFRFTTQGREYGLVVGGSTRFQDSGICLYSSVKAAVKHTEPPLVCFGPGGPLTVHCQDLNFLVRHRIQLPRQKHPMFVLFEKNRTASLKDLRWLLRQLPEMVRTGSSEAATGKRRLERTPERIKSGRAGLFPAYWDRHKWAAA